LSVSGKLSRFYSAGVVYDSGPLQVQLMLSRTRQESAIFEHSRAGYLIAGYRVGELTPFAGYSWAKSSPKTLSTGLGAAIDATVARVMADSHSDQHTLIGGLRWDFRRNMALKAQIDAIRGTPQSIFPTRWEKADYNGRMNIYSLALDFVF
jgi:predicted porin